MNFLILTPLRPPYRVRGWWEEWWWGGENFFVYCGRCVWIWIWVLNNFFFLEYGPLNPWRGSWVQTPGTPGRPPYGPLPVRT